MTIVENDMEIDFENDEELFDEDVPDLDWEAIAEYQELDRIDYETSVRFRNER